MLLLCAVKLFANEKFKVLWLLLIGCVENNVIKRLSISVKSINIRYSKWIALKINRKSFVRFDHNLQSHIINTQRHRIGWFKMLFGTCMQHISIYMLLNKYMQRTIRGGLQKCTNRHRWTLNFHRIRFGVWWITFWKGFPFCCFPLRALCFSELKWEKNLEN